MREKRFVLDAEWAGLLLSRGELEESVAASAALVELGFCGVKVDDLHIEHRTSKVITFDVSVYTSLPWAFLNQSKGLKVAATVVNGTVTSPGEISTMSSLALSHVLSLCLSGVRTIPEESDASKGNVHNQRIRID